MGWQAFVAPFIQAGNTIILNSSGFFVYNGSPTGGNLVATSAPVAGVDPYGNPYLAGDAVYGALGSFVNIATNNGFRGFPALTLNAPGMVHVTDLGQVASDNVNPGAANEQAKIALSSGKENSLDDGAILLYSESADGTIGAAVVIEFGGDFLVTVNRGGFFLGDGTNNFPLKFIPGLVTHMTDLPTIAVAGKNAGGVNEQNQMFMTSGTSSSLDNMLIAIYSEAADGSAQATGQIAAAATNIALWSKNNWNFQVPVTSVSGSQANPTLITTDSWHRVPAGSFQNGWTGVGGDLNGIIYRFTTDNELEIWFDIINAAIQVNTTVFTFAGLLVPTVAQKHEIAGAGGSGIVWAQLNTNGTWVMTGTVAANHELAGRCKYALGSLP
jgi:hypothetical protein